MNTRIALRATRWLAALLTIGLVAGAQAYEVETKEPLKLPLINSSDFDFITTVYGEVLKEAGYNVDYINADDLYVSFCWDTDREICDSVVATGKALNAGSSGVEIREGWWYPKYLEKDCPGLPDWKALLHEGCVKALSVAETAPKARFVAPPADWVSFTPEIIEAFGLEFEPIVSGSATALGATIQGALQRNEPIIGWGYLPHWLMATNPGDFVAFPPYERACREDPSWGPNPDKLHDCAPAFGYVWKIVNKGIADGVPGSLRTLYLLRLSAQDVGTGMQRVDLDGKTLVEAAREWLDANRAEWSKWIR
jgi:glycine betaine/proline transport system substrate-binding protein